MALICEAELYIWPRNDLNSSASELCVLQCDGLKMELQELQVMYDSSQRERAELEEELQRCKAELEKLSGGPQVSGGREHRNTPRKTHVEVIHNSRRAHGGASS